MKKKLEADLISIAHRILKLKSKSDINQLYLETQKLYEKLAVLKFVEDNFDNLKPTIGQREINTELETIFNNQEIVASEITNETVTSFEEPQIAEPKEEITKIAVQHPEITIPEAEIEIKETIITEPTPVSFSEIKEQTETTEVLTFKTVSDSKPIPEFKPAFELEREPEEIEEPKKAETETKSDTVHISFEEILGVNYADAQFVKVDSIENTAISPTPSINEFKEKITPIETAILDSAKPKTVPLNEKLARGFHIDLNDRIAFTKNLFGNSTEDYSRVLNQLMTFGSYSEAKEFIENMVKPDYNNWEGKEDYAERFMGIIEKKFS